MNQVSNNTRVQVPNDTQSGNSVNHNGAHDAVSLNPSGRGNADNNTSKRIKFMQCNKTVTISSLNTRTLSQKSKREELVHKIKDSQIDILGIQKHRIVHEEPFRYEESQGTLLITHSAWRNEIGASNGGVGFIINTKANKSFLNVKAFGNRILVANFSGNPATTVINAYSPTNAEQENVVDQFYDDMRSAISTVPLHNVLIVLGDLNARVGHPDGKLTFHAETNRNGEKLIELAQESSLEICNTMFQKPKSKLWTHVSPNGDKYQLDYIYKEEVEKQRQERPGI